MQRLSRLKKELERFQSQPPPGIFCWSTDNAYELKASVIGPDDTPYENGVFHIDLEIPERYPFEPPKLRFATPVYHPNVDNSGRICLDVLKLPPSGSWKPSLNLAGVLSTVQLLMREPNFDDPLMSEISEEYRSNRLLFLRHAKEWTQKYANSNSMSKQMDTVCHSVPDTAESQDLKNPLGMDLSESKRRRLQ